MKTSLVYSVTHELKNKKSFLPGTIIFPVPTPLHSLKTTNSHKAPLSATKAPVAATNTTIGVRVRGGDGSGFEIGGDGSG